MLPAHPGWYCYTNHQCVHVKVAGDNLNVPVRTAQNLTVLNNLAKQFIPANRTFIAVPYCPELCDYSAVNLPCGIYYALSPRSEAFNKMKLKESKHPIPAFAIIDKLSSRWTR